MAEVELVAKQRVLHGDGTATEIGDKFSIEADAAQTLIDEGSAEKPSSSKKSS